MMLTVGIPKEIKALEKRVGLTPSAVRQLTDKKVTVYVERSAGEGSGFSDDDYKKAGAEILPDAAAVYGKADLIQKVKEPLEQEFRLIRKNQILFCYLHLASPENCALVETLVRSGATAVGYETVELGGRFPLLAPMSEIAGALAATYGAILKTEDYTASNPPKPSDVYGLLEKAAAKYPEVNPQNSIGRVLIFGGGVAGFKALETALKMKYEQIVVIEKNLHRQEFLKRFTKIVLSPEDPLKNVLEAADVIIGSVHSRGARAVQVFDEKLLKEISKKKKKVIIDIAIDQGGNFPQSGPTTYKDPIYFDLHGNLRFGVANMPSLCGRGASEALSAVTVPYTVFLAQDPVQAFSTYPELASGINVKDKKILLETIRQAHHRL